MYVCRIVLNQIFDSSQVATNHKFQLAILHGLSPSINAVGGELQEFSSFWNKNQIITQLPISRFALFTLAKKKGLKMPKHTKIGYFSAHGLGSQLGHAGQNPLSLAQ